MHDYYTVSFTWEKRVQTVHNNKIIRYSIDVMILFFITKNKEKMQFGPVKKSFLSNSYHFGEFLTCKYSINMLFTGVCLSHLYINTIMLVVDEFSFLTTPKQALQPFYPTIHCHTPSDSQMMMSQESLHPAHCSHDNRTIMLLKR